MSDNEHQFNPVPRRILVPIDGDPPSEGAFAQAAYGMAAVAVPAGDELTREHVGKARDRLPETVRSRAIFAMAAMGPAVVQAVDAEAVDLVVVAMRRGGEIAHLFRDGEDRYVLHHAGIPVLVVPEA